jgi:hypothetical protein
MKRRHLLIGGLATVGIAAAGLVAADVFTEHETASAVRRRLHVLHLDGNGPETFAKDKVSELLAKRPSWFRIKYHIRELLARPGALVNLQFPYTDPRSKRARLEDNLATIYLLSTDFFWNGADESKLVRYIALYDPLRACGNPFARRPPGLS